MVLSNSLYRMASVLLVFAVGVFVLSGCKEQQARGVVDDETVLATVNGEDITVGDYKMLALGRIPDDIKERRQLLDKLISNRLVGLKVMHGGLDAASRYGSLVEMFYLAALPVQLREEVARDVEVGDEELPEERIPGQAVVELYQIVTPTEEEAQAALKELSSGRPFEEVAKERSKGIAAHAGGYMGKVNLETALFTPGEKAVINNLKPGEHSPVMKTEIGYSITMVKGRVEAEEVRKVAKERLREEVKKKKVDQGMAGLLAGLKEKADIQVNPAIAEGNFEVDWAAKVNGQAVSISPALQGASHATDSHQTHQGMNVETVMTSLARTIDSMLLTQEAKRRGLDKTERMKRAVKLKTDEFAVEAYLDSIGPFDATPEEVKAYYDKNKEFFRTKTILRLSRILVEDKAAADKALKEIRSGREFSEVASEVSVDSSRAKGGDMGWRMLEQVGEPFKSVVTPLKAGELSGVFKSEYGYEIMKVVDRKEGGVPELSELEQKIAKRVTLGKRSDKVRALYDEAYGNASVKVDEDVLKSL